MKWIKRLAWLAFFAALGFGVRHAYEPQPLLVDSAHATRGELLVTVDDDGRTRVRERYTVSAPLPGRLLRTALIPGDAVHANKTLVAEFEPLASTLLDARSRAEAQARVGRAEAALKRAQAREAKAKEDWTFAEAEMRRVGALRGKSVITQTEYDRTVRDERGALLQHRAAQFDVQVARFELETVRASLLEFSTSTTDVAEGASAPSRRWRLRSPIDGLVLRVFERSARTLAGGVPILEIGNTQALEVVADYLSQDAVRVRPGMTVRIAGWGGEESALLDGTVRVVEPAGYTKISALGVEEQRVNIVIDPAGDSGGWNALGDNYRVEVQIVLREQADILLVPAGALFREGESWCVLVIEDGFARLRKVKVGDRGGLSSQITAGIVEGDEVILYPSSLVADGDRVQSRHAP